MIDFTYSVIRSFNQYMASNLGTDKLVVSGTLGTLLLNSHPANANLTNDTVTCYFYDEQIRETGGRMVGTKGRIGDFWCQIDVFSPPNANGEPRQGINRQFKDRVEEALKPKVRVDLIEYGTAGTSVAGGMYVRQESASWQPQDDMDGWSRWRLQYKLSAVDTD